MQRLRMRCDATAHADVPVSASKPSIRLPATYNRLVAKRVGTRFSEVAQVETLPLALPGAGEVLVQMHYAGINGGCETFRARGEFWFKENGAKPYFTLGAEGSGTVVAVGSGVQGIEEGQAVACNMAAAFTEFSICKAMSCTPIKGMSIAQATATTLSGLTAIAALEGTAKIQAGEVVAVTAAAGGTGHFAVQLALLAGCTVVAVCGGPNKVAALKDMAKRQGYSDKLHVINYKAQDVNVELPLICPNGVDVVYEGVGGSIREAMLTNLSPTGRLLQVGYISEYPHVEPGASDARATSSSSSSSSSSAADMPPMSELFWEGKEVRRGEQRIIGKIWPSDPAEIARCKKRIFQLVSEGKMEAWVDTSHGFRGIQGVAQAVDYMLRGGSIGKVVIPLLPEP